MNVDDIVAEKIAAARIKVQAAKQRRDDLAAARKRGLTHRHAQKLAHLAEREQRQAEGEHQADDDPSNADQSALPHT